MANKKELIIQLQNRNKNAYKLIVNKYYQRLLTYFKYRVKNNDEIYNDFIQEVLASFFEAIDNDKIIDDSYIAPYIFGVAKRVIYYYYYKTKRDENLTKKYKNFNINSFIQEDDKTLFDEQLIDHINMIIEKLPEIDKIIIKEFYLKEKDLDEISEITGKDKHYLSVRKERALKKIKNEINKMNLL